MRKYKKFLPAEENVGTEPAVVSTGEDLQDSPLSVANHVELGQGHLGDKMLISLTKQLTRLTYHCKGVSN